MQAFISKLETTFTSSKVHDGKHLFADVGTAKCDWHFLHKTFNGMNFEVHPPQNFCIFPLVTASFPNCHHFAIISIYYFILNSN
jgi:hypothetical protein